MHILRNYIDEKSPVSLSRRQLSRAVEGFKGTALSREVPKITLPEETIVSLMKGPATTLDPRVREFISQHVHLIDPSLIRTNETTNLEKGRQGYLESRLTQLREALDYQLYLAAMQKLHHTPLSDRAWRCSSGFINDQAPIRQAAQKRWQSLIANGTKVNHQIQRFAHEHPWSVRDISAACMLTLKWGTIKIETTPKSVTTWRGSR